MIAAQKSCGNRAIGRNPILCCSDGVVPVTQPPTPPPTQAPTQAPSSSSCTDPKGAPGVCKSEKNFFFVIRNILKLILKFSDIGDCDSVVNELKARSSDPDFKQYIQKSNEICNYATRTVCCPSGSPPTNSIQNEGFNSLITPEEGCGYSNVTHSRVVGGVSESKDCFLDIKI